MRPDSKLVFSTDQTAILKGLAILFMLMHHCLIPEFYDEPPQILHSFFVTHLMVGMRICVGIFTFIIGYGYAFQKEHSYAYSFRHVWRLVSRYWILFAVLFLPVYLVGGVK